VAVSPDGETVLVAGNGMFRSLDAGKTFQPLVVDASSAFADVRVGEDGEGVAVGNAGAIAHVDSAGIVTVQHAGTADLKTLHIADAEDAEAIGYAGGVGGQVWMTPDNGITWSAGPNLGHTILGVDQIGAGHR